MLRYSGGGCPVRGVLYRAVSAGQAAKTGELIYPAQRGKCLPQFRGNGGTFLRHRKMVCCFKGTPKLRPTDRSAIRRAKQAGSLALLLSRWFARLFACTGTVRLQCFCRICKVLLRLSTLHQVPANYICLCRKICYIFISCNCWKLSAYR